MSSEDALLTERSKDMKKQRAKRIQRGEAPSLAFALFVGSIIDTVIATAYCAGAFVLFWLVLDDPVNFPGLFPLRIDTAVEFIFLIALVYGNYELRYLRSHYDKFVIAFKALRASGVAMDLRNLSVLPTPAQTDSGEVVPYLNYALNLEHSGKILQQSRGDYYLYIGIYVLAAVLPWNLWGYTRETLFGGLALFVPIIWFLFALNAYIRLFCLPSKTKDCGAVKVNPMWMEIELNL